MKSFVLGSILILIGLLFTGCAAAGDNLNPPVVEKVVVEKLVCSAGEDVDIRVVASDADQDELKYTWLCSSGEFLLTTTGDVNVFRAPGIAGQVQIKILISDGQNDVEANETITVEAATSAGTNLSITYTPGGFTLPATAQTLIYGTSYQLSAVAFENYHFTEWNIESGVENLETDSLTTATINVRLNRGTATVQAIFAPDVYHLTVNAVTGGYAIPYAPQPITVYHAQTTVIRAIPNIGYTFTRWNVTPPDSATMIANINHAETTARLTGDVILTPVFTINSYAVTFSSTGEGNGTTFPIAPGNYNHGSNIALRATPVLNNVFHSWSAIPPGNAVFANPTLATTNVQILGPVTIQARFDLSRYSVTYHVEGEGFSYGLIVGNTNSLVLDGTVLNLSVVVTDDVYDICSWRANPAQNAIFSDIDSQSTQVTIFGNVVIYVSLDC